MARFEHRKTSPRERGFELWSPEDLIACELNGFDAPRLATLLNFTKPGGAGADPLAPVLKIEELQALAANAALALELRARDERAAVARGEHPGEWNEDAG